MEYILIHTPNNNYSKETMPAIMEMGKTLGEDPGKFVPGGKLLAAYGAQAKMLIVCIWDAPSIDALMPPMEQMAMLGFNTEVIPADRMEVKMEKLAKAMAV
jgi:hypothetical protein